MGDDKLFSRGEIGRRGEEEAILFLKNRGLFFREKNWRAGRKEVDIIMEDENIIHFIEVKTRSIPSLISPFESINKKKQKNILSAAASYLRINKIKKEVLFGVVSVEVLNGKIYNIEYFPDAFSSNWK